MNRFTSPMSMAWFLVAIHREPMYISTANTQPNDVLTICLKKSSSQLFDD